MEKIINKSDIKVLKSRAIEFLYDYLNANCQNDYANHTTGPTVAMEIIKFYYINIASKKEDINSELQEVQRKLDIVESENRILTQDEAVSRQESGIS